MILERADLARYQDVAEACWVQDVRFARITWANAAAVRELRATSLEELLARDISPRSEASRTRLASYLVRVGDGGAVQTQWTVFNPGQPTTFLAEVQAFRLDDGALALFFAARMIGDSVCPEGLRMLEASRHSVASFGLFSLAGKLLEKNAAYIREFGEDPASDGDDFLALFTDPGEGDRIRSEIVTKSRFRGRVCIRVGRETRWHMLLALTILDPADGQRVMQVELIDITDQVEAEHRATAAEKLLQGAADEFAHPVAFVRADKTFAFVNRTYCAWSSTTPAEIVGRSVREVVGPEVDEIWDRTWPAMQKGERATFERISRFRIRGDRWMSYDLIPHREDDGVVRGAFVFGYDIHALKMAESGLKSNERQLNLMADNLPVGVALLDLQMRVLFANAILSRWFSLRPETIMGRHVAELIGEIAFDETQSFRDRALLGETVQFRRASINSGLTRWVDCTIAPSHDEDGKVAGIIAVYQDVTERVEGRAALNRARDALSSHLANTPLAVIQMDRDHRITQWTGRAQALFGWAEGDTVGKKLDELRIFGGGSEQALQHQLLKLAQDGGESFTMAFRNMRRDGAAMHMEWSVSVLRDGGVIDSYLMLVQDITAKVSAESDVQYLATHDALTGLGNRRQFSERLAHEMGRAKRIGSRLAVLLVDIDRFRYVNESLGHSAGDALLQQVALRLQAAALDGEVLARTGPDEFMVLADLMNDERRAVTAAYAIRNLLSAPFQLDGQELFMTASVGAAIFPDDAFTEAEVIRKADLALDWAKASGRNSIQFYSPTMARGRHQRLIVEGDLRRALERSQFHLLYQPKRNIAGGGVTGVEALLRWTHPEQGIITPDQFIVLAEDSGLIVDIGRWVIHEACRQMQAWTASGLTSVQVAVNLSAVQLRRRELPAEVLEALSHYELPGAALMVEVTESSVVSDPILASASLEALRDNGVQAAIDDFGTGFSSLGQLKRLPIDALKVDGSFVRDVPIDRENAAIVQAIIGLARNLEMNVIAEGVETSEQLAFLSKHNCDEAQGYLISEPLAGDVLAQKFLSVAPTAANVN